MGPAVVKWDVGTHLSPPPTSPVVRVADYDSLTTNLSPTLAAEVFYSNIVENLRFDT